MYSGPAGATRGRPFFAAINSAKNLEILLIFTKIVSLKFNLLCSIAQVGGVTRR